MGPVTYRPPPQRRKSGLLVTNELNEAIERCRSKVKSLAAECRANNRKFTDIEWDLSTNWTPCMYKLSGGDNYNLRPTEVRRVTDIFEKPVFFEDGATASDIRQGGLGDCWFLSAMGVVAAAGLIEKICVERDEQVGIYGFIFWRDSGWVDVIIDDYLCTKVPKWEELEDREKMIYKYNKDTYLKQARKGGHTLMFARSDTENETWVPLLEKAYAKLHGDYESIAGGFTGEGIEDLTGAVSTSIFLKDLLDPDRFWKEELMMIGVDRVFSCGTPGTGEIFDADNLVSGHAYAILKAVEHEGRRFVVIRNPWGRSEWSGRWSDGSKEWNDEYAVGLKKALGDFKFGDDGEFVQEYEDFLRVWEDVDRNRLFDDTWIVNAQWLGFYPENHKTWSHGDITFTISVDGTTDAVICLAQMDPRYFQEQFGMYNYNLDFTVFKKGETIPFGRSTGNQYWRRSVKMQTVLEPGEYVVQVRIRRQKIRETSYDFSEFDEDKLARKRTEWAMSKSIAVNFDPASTDHIPLPPSLFTGTTLLELQVDAQEQINTLREKQQARKKTNTEAREAIAKQKAEEEAKKAEEEAKKAEEANGVAEGEGAEGEGEKKEEAEGPEVNGKTEETAEPVSDDEEEEPVEESPEEEEPTSKRKKNRRNKKKKGAFFNKALEAARRARFSTPYGAEEDQGEECPQSGGEEEGADGEEGSNTSGESADAKITIVVQEEEPEPYVFECTECTEQIKGVLHHCMESGCISYNVCDDCKKFDDHPSGHVFVKFTSPEDAQAIVEENDDGGESELVLGLRVYTQRDVPATVRGHIRKGSILRKHYLKKK